MGRPDAEAKSGGWFKDLGPKFGSATSTRQELQLLPLKLHSLADITIVFALDTSGSYEGVGGAAAAKGTDAEPGSKGGC